MKKVYYFEIFFWFCGEHFSMFFSYLCVVEGPYLSFMAGFWPCFGECCGFLDGFSSWMETLGDFGGADSLPCSSISGIYRTSIKHLQSLQKATNLQNQQVTSLQKANQTNKAWQVTTSARSENRSADRDPGNVRKQPSYRMQLLSERMPKAVRKRGRKRGRSGEEVGKWV